MSDWLDAIPNLGVPGVPGVPPQKSVAFSGTPREMTGVPGVPTDSTRSGGNPPVSASEHLTHAEHVRETQHRATLRDWHRHLSALDFDTAPAHFDLRRWRQLCEDAWWLYEGFASQLVPEGWSAHDVFGVLPGRPGGGVLLDRLHGARNLKLDGEGRAFWTSFGVTFQTCRGASDSLMSSGLVLVWEI